MIWFTSDLHFGHDRDFIYKPRGFKSLSEMNAIQLQNWNKLVQPDDDIYVLGDFFLGNDFDFIRNTLAKLQGKIHLIIGNHDTDVKIHMYQETPNIVEIVYATRLTYHGITLYLSHYPSITMNNNDFPNKQKVYNLFGHTHSKEKFYYFIPYMYNVSVDAHDNCPVSIDTVISDLLRVQEGTPYDEV